ncbi:MAG: NAD(P)/FAD-dependent oxidoreductase [Putridiphycobacter sp.]
MSNNTHFNIIGWGLAGTTIAWQLYFDNQNFSVFDSTTNHSTKTAAGLVNPIVFKRLTKSWNADILMPFAKDFYQKIETILKAQIIKPKNIYKVFNSFEDENNWVVKQSDSRFESYLELQPPSFKIEHITAPFGFGKVKTFGNLDTIAFLEKSKSFFEKKGILFTNHPFDYNTVETNKKYIFCEGYDIKNNPFFNYLPLKPTHGETLIIKTKSFKFTEIVNKNMFVMHIKDDLFKVGATYNWSLSEPVTTKSGREELIEKLNQFANFEYEIVSHQAGIRPTVKDRRPLVGVHPKHDNLFVFNGLGTKGVMIAPYYGHQLLNFIKNQQPLDNEINITRYEKYLT